MSILEFSLLTSLLWTRSVESKKYGSFFSWGPDMRTLTDVLDPQLPVQGPLTVVVTSPNATFLANCLVTLSARVTAVVNSSGRFRHDLMLWEPAAVLIFLGSDPVEELKAALPPLRHSSYWTPSVLVLVLAMEPDISVITAMGETLAWSSVQRSVAVAWSEQQKAVRRWDLPLHMSRPETRGFVMLSCAPELSPPKGSTVDSNYRPHYPSQYLGQLFVQRVASLLGAPCLPYFGKPFGSRLGNGSFDGYVADMAAGSLLFVASIALPVTDVAPVVQYLYPVQKDDFCAIIRSPEPLSFLDSVEIVYERDTWIGLAACLLTFAFVQGLSSGNILRALLETYETAVTGGFRRSASLPALWLTLSVCGVVLVNSFTGGLTSYLAVPRIAPSIDTLEQVDSVADVINLYPEYMRRFDNVDSKDIVAKLVNKFRPTRDEPEWQAARASVLRGERRALLLPESHFRMLAMLPRYQRPGTSASLLYRVPQCALRDAYKSFCLPRGSPLLPVLDTLQLRALQSGLYLKFERDSLSNYLSAHAAQRSAVLTPHSTGAQASSSPYSLALSHLQGAFIAFSWAVGVCTVVFAMEVVAQWLPDCQGTLWCGHRRPWNSRHRSMELNQRATWKVLKKWKVPSMQKTASPSA